MILRTPPKKKQKHRLWPWEKTDVKTLEIGACCLFRGSWEFPKKKREPLGGTHGQQGLQAGKESKRYTHQTTVPEPFGGFRGLGVQGFGVQGFRGSGI